MRILGAARDRGHDRDREVRGTAMGLTIVHKSDLSAQDEPEGRAGAGRRRRHRRRLQARRPEGARRLPRQPEDDRLRHLRRALRRRVPRGAARRRGHPGRDARALDGESDEFTLFRAARLLQPEPRGVRREAASSFLVDLVTYFPGAILDFLAETPDVSLETIREPLRDLVRRPTPRNLVECVTPIVDAIGSGARVSVPARLSAVGHLRQREPRALPPLQHRAARADERLPRALPRAAIELYIVAMNLDTAERVVFGHDEDSSLTISEAVQASTALPGFYKPARIKGVDYVDGGVRRTANIDVAIEHGARSRHLLQPVPAVLQPRASRRYDGGANTTSSRAGRSPTRAC